MLRLGLCCLFTAENIKFRTTTAKAVRGLSPEERLKKISDVVEANVAALKQAIHFCHAHGIGAFRINSGILPLKTHPEFPWRIRQLPESERIHAEFDTCRQLAGRNDIRLSFHPDQFVVLNSPRPDVVASSIREIEYQTEAAELVGADVINLHGGGGYGDKPTALDRLSQIISKLPPETRKKLTLENDDRVFTPSDLLPVCQKTGVPLVYDVHHHRCNPDHLSVKEATEACIQTWNREPMFHISSPKQGWGAMNPRPHHDYIDLADFPECWHGQTVTIEVEAKAKELAVRQLLDQLKAR